MLCQAQFKMNFVSAATHAPNDSANWTTSATMDAIPVLPHHAEPPASGAARPGLGASGAGHSDRAQSKRRKTRWND